MTQTTEAADPEEAVRLLCPNSFSKDKRRRRRSRPKSEENNRPRPGPLPGATGDRPGKQIYRIRLLTLPVLHCLIILSWRNLAEPPSFGGPNRSPACKEITFTYCMHCLRVGPKNANVSGVWKCFPDPKMTTARLPKFGDALIQDC